MKSKDKASEKVDSWAKYITSGTRPLVIAVASLMLLIFLYTEVVV